MALIPAIASARAQRSWPEKPVTLIVPFAPGGNNDILGRLIGAKLSETLGQQFIVENRPGSNGIIGAAAVAKAAPDGNTFLVGDHPGTVSMGA